MIIHHLEAFAASWANIIAISRQVKMDTHDDVYTRRDIFRTNDIIRTVMSVRSEKVPALMDFVNDDVICWFCVICPEIRLPLALALNK